jgi:mannose-6-phosphate isomerase-like protein (cupin superfamily)
MDLKKLSVLLLLTPLFAAGPDGFKLWKSAELKAYDKAAPLADFGNHTAQMNHREKNGEVEIHQNWADVMVIESGEAMMAIGGTPVNAKTTAPGEIRAESATGAEKKALAPGDILNIPAGVPHQFLVPAGKQITYFAMKVPAK